MFHYNLRCSFYTLPEPFYPVGQWPTALVSVVTLAPLHCHYARFPLMSFNTLLRGWLLLSLPFNRLKSGTILLHLSYT